MNNSSFLNQVLSQAKKIGKVNSAMTAEKFIIGLYEAVNSKHKLESEMAEALKVASYFQLYIIDDESAKKILIEYIEANKENTFSDSMYMQKKMIEVTTKAEKESKKEINACDVFLCILQEPSVTIKKIMTGEIAREHSDVPANPGSDTTRKEIADALENFFETIDEASADNKDDMNFENQDLDSSVSKKEQMSLLVEDVKRIQKELSSFIIGQDNAINVFATGYFQANLLSMIDISRRRPKATFLFAGPPGVGKTFLAETTAKVLKLPFMRFDMSEYTDPQTAVMEICGYPRSYKEHKPGKATSFVEKNPECILLFDEIEKSCLDVIHLFLQMLDAGTLRDACLEKDISFKDVIIIMTTNAGKGLYEENESNDLSTVSRKVVIKALQKDINPRTGAPYFPAAICSRFASGNVVMFNRMSATFLKSIAKKEIERQADNLNDETGITLNIDEKVYTALLFSEGASVDARTIRGRAETFFNDELHELLRLIASEKVKTGIDDIDNIKISVDLSKATTKILSLFESTELPKILIFAESEIVDLCRKKLPEFSIIGVENTEDAIRAIKNNELSFCLIDLRCGADSSEISSLNIEDIDSSARDF